MKALFLKKLAYVGIYITVALLIEILTFTSMGMGFFPKYFMMDISIILFLSVVIFVIPSFTAEAIIIVFLVTLQAVVSGINNCLNFVDNGYVFSVNMLNLAKEAAGAINGSFVNFAFILAMIFFVVITVIGLVELKKFKVKQSFKLNVVLVLLLTFCLGQLSTFSVYKVSADKLYTIDENEELYVIKSDQYLYETFYNEYAALKRFGTFPYYFISTKRLISGTKTTKEQKDEALDSVNKYLKSGSMSQETKYSGLSKDNNVIVVMMETGEWWGISPEYTPTLYALSTQGISNKTYYARDKTNHSETIGLLGSYPTASFSSTYYTKDSMLKTAVDFALPKYLSSQGYTTSYFHDNYGEFYSRNQTHKNTFGFQNVTMLEDMTEVEGYNDMDFYDWVLDSEMISTNLDTMVRTDNKFYTFFTTITTHGDYEDLVIYGDYNGIEDSSKAKNYNVQNLEKYLVKIDDFGSTADREALDKLSQSEYNTTFLRYKRYQAGLMDLDFGMNILLQDLKAKGELENTTIVMYADHDCYYNNMHYKMRGLDTTEFDNPELYRVPMFIYDGSMPLDVSSTLNYEVDERYDTYQYDDNFVNVGATQQKYQMESVTRFLTTFDIVPTILDLLGYTYNTNIYMGSSIFSSDSVPTIAFKSRVSGIFDNNFYTTDSRNILFKATDDEELLNEFWQKVETYIIKQEMFDKIYNYNFFSQYENGYHYADINNVIKQR